MLKSWKDNGIKNKIIEFVTAVCDEKSDKFIPVKDRIAVTDIDGTLISERGVKVDNDSMCFKTAEQARQYFETIKDEYFDKERKLKYKDYIFKPMIELYEYLVAHDFNVYFVSGNCNALTYALANYFFGADYAHSIGSNIELKIDETGGFQLVPTGNYEGSWCEVKCFRIYNQIGKCPVLAIGNSDGDVEMLKWVLANPEYRGMSVMVNHDDNREYVYDSEQVTDYCEKYGFVDLKISENFKEIYNDK